MRKILIYSALITGCIAPAIFAVAQYASAIESSDIKPNPNTGISYSGNTIKPPFVPSCASSTMREFTSEKVTLTKLYQEKLRNIFQENTHQRTLSGERNSTSLQIKKIQLEYRTSLEQLQQKYILKQRTCIKK